MLEKRTRLNRIAHSLVFDDGIRQERSKAPARRCEMCRGTGDMCLLAMGHLDYVRVGGATGPTEK